MLGVLRPGLSTTGIHRWSHCGRQYCFSFSTNSRRWSSQLLPSRNSNASVVAVSRPPTPCSSVRCKHDGTAVKKSGDDSPDGQSSGAGLLAELRDCDLKNGAGCLSAALENGDLDAEKQTSLFKDLLSSVAEDFSWEGLESITAGSSGRRLMAWASASGGIARPALLSVAKATCSALAEEKDAELLAAGACNLIALLACVTDVPLAISLQLDRLERPLGSGAAGIDSSVTLVRFLGVLSGVHSDNTAARSVGLVLGIYDRLAVTLPAETAWLSVGEMAAVSSCCRAVKRLRVHHTPFLAAWECFLVRQLGAGGFRGTGDASEAVKCFVRLRYFAPKLLAAVSGALADGRLASSSASSRARGSADDETGGLLMLELWLLYSYFLQSLPLPPALANSVARRLSLRPNVELPTASLWRVMEQVFTLLPLELNVTERLWASTLAIRPHYPLNVFSRLAELKSQNSSGWSNVLTNVMCPGGRVPVVALLTADNDTVLPWPRSVQPFMLRKSHGGRLVGGRPVAVLFPYNDSSLRHPANLPGDVAQQRALLLEQGFDVFVVHTLGTASRDEVLQCKSVGDFIRIVQSRPPCL